MNLPSKNFPELAQKHLQELVTRHPAIKGACESQIQQAFEIMAKSQSQNGKVLACGNGGSASDSAHFVGELVKGFLNERTLSAEMKAKLKSIHPNGALLADKLQEPLRAIDLTSSNSILTAIINDNGADLMFAQQVYALAHPEDVVFGISTSGNSKNVVNALIAAKAIGAKTVSLVGRSGGLMKELSDVTIIAPGSNTPAIQECHLPIYHTLCLMLESYFYGKGFE